MFVDRINPDSGYWARVAVSSLAYSMGRKIPPAACGLLLYNSYSFVSDQTLYEDPSRHPKAIASTDCQVTATFKAMTPESADLANQLEYQS